MTILAIERSKKFKEFFDIVKDPRKIDFLVLHHVEANSVEHAIEQFEEHKVSAHFLIAEDGKIFELVEENNIAYHAGISFWKGVVGLNKCSIGIEFINSAPFEKEFMQQQMQSGLELCKYLIWKYAIENSNIVGHSDIAYYSDQIEDSAKHHLLDRKQDPSHLFDWKFLAENGVGIYSKNSLEDWEDEMLFVLGNKDSKISQIRKDLAKFGYKISNFSDEFDLEMQHLTRVFNRRFNQSKFNSDADAWYLSSQKILDGLF